MKTVHGLDADGSPISMTFAGDCLLILSGIEPEQEHSIKVITTESEQEITDFIGERPRHEERN